MEDNKKDDNKYEKICYMCRRPESKTGTMISMPGGIDICPDCIQKTFNSMQSMDISKLSGKMNMDDIKNINTFIICFFITIPLIYCDTILALMYFIPNFFEITIFCI